eukprot:750411-Hanusia_phi.AAC.2
MGGQEWGEESFGGGIGRGIKDRGRLSSFVRTSSALEPQVVCWVTARVRCGDSRGRVVRGEEVESLEGAGKPVVALIVCSVHVSCNGRGSQWARSIC